jgi:type IX secretion system PorP/SprF family membrane protein
VLDFNTKNAAFLKKKADSILYLGLCFFYRLPMSHMKQLITCFLGCILTFGVLAQQDAHFSQYMFNTLYLNPAFAGSEGFTRIQLLYRNQWTGYSPSNSLDGSGGNPETVNLSLNAPILRLRSGVGLHLLQDRLGPVTNLEGQATFAYHFPLRTGKLSLGARIGLFSQVLDFQKYRAVDSNGPILDENGQPRGRESQLRPDAALGFFFRTERYYLGASINHLIKSEFNYGIASLQNALNNNLSVVGGINVDLNYTLAFSPSVLVKSDLNTYQVELNALFTYNRDFWGGFGFRQGEGIPIILGLNTLKDKRGVPLVRVGYAFDLILSGADAKQRTSSEIMLAYRFPEVNPTSRTVTRTPRFRH